MRKLEFRVVSKKTKKIIPNQNILLSPDGRVFLAKSKPSIFRKKYIGNTPFEEITKDVEINFWSGEVDKKGQKIYEGDIVLYKVHGDETFIGKVYISERPIEILVKHRLLKDLRSVKVIGNIYKNPELLGDQVE